MVQESSNTLLLEKPNFYFIGIGGIGMSALARFFHGLGKKVAGYDKTASPLTQQLVEEGISIHYIDDDSNIYEGFKDIEDTIVVYTPAIPENHIELSYFIQNGFSVFKRSEILGLISRNYFTIAIAGTHGKTTTSSIISHIIQKSERTLLAFVGGIGQNSNSNLLQDKEPEIMVTEADEYDKSFLTLHPDIALITSTDADHLDIYGTVEEIKKTFHEFADQIKPNGCLIAQSNTGIAKKNNYINYAIESGDYFAKDLKIINGQYHFNIQTPDATISNCILGLPGKHNAENAIGAAAIADKLNISHDIIKAALASYKGVKRRFEIHIQNTKLVYIDDYAHHPKEIDACIDSVKEMYPGKKLTGIFQPHLFSRTKDFEHEFATSLSALDELILLDIYPARELPIEGVSSAHLLQKVQLKNKTLCSKKDLLNRINKKEIEVLLTMGAGDIDRLVEPIKTFLNE